MEKILIHFDTNDTYIYKLVDENITLLEHKQVFFNETLVNDELFRKINRVLDEVNDKYGKLNNKNTRLYATGIFQEFSKEFIKLPISFIFCWKLPHTTTFLNS